MRFSKFIAIATLALVLLMSYAAAKKHWYERKLNKANRVIKRTLGFKPSKDQQVKQNLRQEKHRLKNE
jgi:hypothetical protein